jgi:hypothetical protein
MPDTDGIGRHAMRDIPLIVGLFCRFSRAQTAIGCIHSHLGDSFNPDGSRDRSRSRRVALITNLRVQQARRCRIGQ